VLDFEMHKDPERSPDEAQRNPGNLSTIPDYPAGLSRIPLRFIRARKYSAPETLHRHN